MSSSSVQVYVSAQCLNCARFIKSLRRVRQLRVQMINVDSTAVQGITAVPTVVDGGQVLVGTAAFEWLHRHEASIPLDAYATVLGAGAGGLTYTDLDADETVDVCPFSDF